MVGSGRGSRWGRIKMGCDKDGVGLGRGGIRIGCDQEGAR